jgi:hypothetical protein
MRFLPLLALSACASAGTPDLHLRSPSHAVLGEEIQVYVRAAEDGPLSVTLAKVGEGAAPPVERRVEARKGHKVLVTFVARERGPYRVQVAAGTERREAPLRVGSREPRVLLVEQLPRWEYRYLKNALLRDPGVRVHCLLTSADEGFPQEHTRSDEPLFRAPLQGFPADLRALDEFDVVILGDVDVAKLGRDAAANLAAFVRERGGGLVLISGPKHNPWSCVETPLGELIPVVPERPAPEQEAYEYVFSAPAFFPFQPVDDLPPLRWAVQARSREGGEVKTYLRGVGPLFVTRECGAGRIFWSGTDETWLWRKYVGDRPYFYPFWRRVIDWTATGR